MKVIQRELSHFVKVVIFLLLQFYRNDSRDQEFKVKEWESLNLDTDNLILKDDGFDHESTFNLASESQIPPKFPYRQNRAGKTTGLSILLDPDLESYFCTNTDSAGFMVHFDFNDFEYLQILGFLHIYIYI